MDQWNRKPTSSVWGRIMCRRAGGEYQSVMEELRMKSWKGVCVKRTRWSTKLYTRSFSLPLDLAKANENLVLNLTQTWAAVSGTVRPSFSVLQIELLFIFSGSGRSNLPNIILLNCGWTTTNVLSDHAEHFPSRLVIVTFICILADTSVIPSTTSLTSNLWLIVLKDNKVVTGKLDEPRLFLIQSGSRSFNITGRE